MPKFIKLDRVPVSDDNGNTVYVRSKMDAGAVSRIQGAGENGVLIAMLQANILSWSGPDFFETDRDGNLTTKPLKCTPENIARLDPQDPFWNQVIEKIAELNPRQDAAASFDDTGDGASTSPVQRNLQVSSA